MPPFWLPWCLPFLGFIRLSRRTPDLAAFPAVQGPTVSFIIPARNEAGTIETVLESILASTYHALELIVVDDHSTDETAPRVRTIAEANARVRLISAADLPPGWYGKPWACHQGYRAATGDILVFTDADTRHAPALLGHAVAHPELRRLVAVTDPDNIRSQRVLAACGLADHGLRDRRQASRRGSRQVRSYELALIQRSQRTKPADS